MNRYSLSADGRFLDRGQRIIPLGVNWWPASCGTDMWLDWPEAEIRADLAVVKSLGMDTVRFFLRWQDFEPEAGRFEPRAFARLDQLLGWIGELGLRAHPSLFVGWMSGGIFWPAWKGERNLYTDPLMVERGGAFVAEAATVFARHRDAILAVDIGNEMDCLPDNGAASPAAISAFVQRICDAVRGSCPGMLMVGGCDQGQLIWDAWRFDGQPGTDFLSMHGYPVQGWHALEIDGMGDPLTADLLPAYCAAARGFGPVMLQEFGTILGGSAERQRTYLSRMLPAAFAAGANGFLYWCLRDIPPSRFPYTRYSMETRLGLIGADNRVKPGLEPFIDLVRGFDPERQAIPQGRTALAWPRKYYDREEPENCGNSPKQNAARLPLAYHLLAQCGERPLITRLERIPAGVDTIIVAGAAMDHLDQLALLAFVEAGGHLVWHGPQAGHWGETQARLIGAWSCDHRAHLPVRVEVFGRTWNLPESTVERTTWQRIEVTPTTAKIIARDQHGLPMVGVNQVGRGTVAWALPLVEDGIVPISADIPRRSMWAAWYAGMLQLVRSGSAS